MRCVAIVPLPSSPAGNLQPLLRLPIHGELTTPLFPLPGVRSLLRTSSHFTTLSFSLARETLFHHPPLSPLYLSCRREPVLCTCPCSRSKRCALRINSMHKMKKFRRTTYLLSEHARIGCKDLSSVNFGSILGFF